MLTARYVIGRLCFANPLAAIYFCSGDPFVNQEQDLSFSVIPHPAPTSAADRQALLDKGGFGTVFSDHMVTIEWTQGRGWHDAQVRARAPFSIDPASAVLHYAQEIFEGMKAYRAEGGGVTLFRPDQNAHRFNLSAARLAMPQIPEKVFLEAVEKLVSMDRDWIPGTEGSSLYLRPFMFANEPFLGVRSAHNFIFCVIASPVGNYFKGGGKPLTLWVSTEYTRAARGGTGEAKCGGNYAASLVAQMEATENGCDQVVFLDAAEHRWVEELGGMNIFFVMDDGTLLTTPLGTILRGITRDSVIQLAKDQGMNVQEAPYSFEQWQADAASGKLREVFACGTAAVIASIGEVRHRGGSFTIGNGQSPVAEQLRERLVGIQRGRKEDTYGWLHHIA